MSDYGYDRFPCTCRPGTFYMCDGCSDYIDYIEGRKCLPLMPVKEEC